MERRAFLRLIGVAAAGALAALVAPSVRHATAVNVTSERALAQPGRPPDLASLPPQLGQIASTPNFGAMASHQKAMRGAMMRNAEVVPSLYRLTDIRGVNAYIWMPRPGGPSELDEAILFDCGWPWSARNLTASLAGLGCPPGDIRTIAITHADFDHAGQLAALAAEGRAEIVAHELEAPRLASGQWRALPGAGRSLDPVILVADPLYRRWPARPVKTTRPLRDGDEIGDGWIAIHTPGHTPGHTAFYRPKSRVLIAGDALGSVRNSQIRLPKRIYAEDWAAALRSVRKLADLNPDVICFGHGRELHQASGLLQALAGSLPAQGEATSPLQHESLADAL